MGRTRGVPKPNWRKRLRLCAQWSLVALFSVAASRKAAAQPLYGFGPVAGEANPFAFAIDTQTGAFTRLGTVGDVQTGPGALDPSGRRLFLLSFPSLSFLTLNLDSGIVSVKPSYIDGGFIEYSTRRRTLYEIGSPPGTPPFQFVYSVDPDTGLGTDIASFTDLAPRSTALDDDGQRLFILGGSSQGPRLWTLEVVSGLTSAVAVPDTAPGFSLQWDGGSRTLYGVGSLAGESEASLFRIDSGNGDVSRLAHLGDMPIATAAISPRQARVFFTTPPGTLSAVDLISGTISSVSIERCCPQLFDGVLAPTASVPAVAGPALAVMVAALALVGAVWARKVI